MASAERNDVVGNTCWHVGWHVRKPENSHTTRDIYLKICDGIVADLMENEECELPLPSSWYSRLAGILLAEPIARCGRKAAMEPMRLRAIRLLLTTLSMFDVLMKIIDSGRRVFVSVGR